MATTAGTTFPMVPIYNPYAGTGAVPVRRGTAFDTGIARGDVLIYNTEDLDEDNSAPATNTVVGVALEAQATAAAEFTYCPALPGVEFECNLINGASDHTGAESTDLGVKYGILESADGFACADVAAGAITLALRYGRQTNAPSATSTGWNANAFGTAQSGHGLTNPRVVIVFVDSIWTTT